jgi:uncharacterized protein YbaP (TraB family)
VSIKSAVRRWAAFALMAGVGLWAIAGHGFEAGKPGLWHVEGPSGSIYLMGSVHVLDQANPWTTPEIDAAFQESRCLALEIDLGSAAPMTIAAKLRGVGQYDPDGPGLEQHVSDETYQRFRNVVGDLSVSPESLDRFRPWLVGIILTSVIADKLGYSEQNGVDTYFMTRAEAVKTPIVGLESLDDQIAVLSDTGEETDDEALGDVLDDVAREPAMIKAVADAWRHGDLDAIAKKVAEAFANHPEEYDRLIGQRNRHWLPKLDKMLTAGRHCFVVVGAGHLVGKDSLLTLLKDAGYTVTRE